MRKQGRLQKYQWTRMRELRKANQQTVCETAEATKEYEDSMKPGDTIVATRTEESGKDIKIEVPEVQEPLPPGAKYALNHTDRTPLIKDMWPTQMELTRFPLVSQIAYWMSVGARSLLKSEGVIVVA